MKHSKLAKTSIFGQKNESCPSVNLIVKIHMFQKLNSVGILPTVKSDASKQTLPIKNFF